MHADQHRPGDDAVADVELDHLWNSRYRQDIVIIEAMAAMDFEAQPLGELRAGDYLAQFPFALCAIRVAVAAGMNLDAMGAGFPGAFDLRLVRVDEQRDLNTARLQTELPRP